MNDLDRPVQHKKAAFLAAYSKSGNIFRSAKIADISRQSHYDWLEGDAEYAVLFQDAEGVAAAALEAEARRRAIEGIDEPVGFYKGQASAMVKKFSDTLLIFLMKGAMPEKYGDRYRAEITGKGGEPLFKMYAGIDEKLME